MKTSFAATIFAVASLPLLGQMPSTSTPGQVGNSPTQQSIPGETHPGAGSSAPASQPESSAGAPAATSRAQGQSSNAGSPSADVRPVNGKLVAKLDSKTAKPGDDVVLQTESSVSTADGGEIPKGAKVIGHVVAVHPSGGQTSQVVLLFDRAELKDGKTISIRSEIESVGPAMADTAAGPDAAMGAAAAPSTGTTSGETSPSGSSMANTSRNPAGSADKGTAAGTIVSRNGNIAIRTTSIPGVMLANNAPGEHDPRMAQASGLLLGASKDVQLDSGTRFVLDVAPTTASAPQKP